MRQQLLLSQVNLNEKEKCKVLYHKAKDIIELEIGGISLRLESRKFFMMNEMLRKAAARLAMQTELHSM